VIGCGGSGKTTLARRLGERLGLPVVHGDFLGRRGDGRAQGEEWAALHASVIARHEWILDAMRLGTLDERLVRADTAVFLDLPRRACYAGVIARRRRYRGGVDPASGVADRVNLGFLRWIWRFPGRERRRVLALLDAHAETTDVVVLRGRADVERFLVSRTGAAASARRSPTRPRGAPSAPRGRWRRRGRARAPSPGSAR
jgi:adenylate kinase family enzyme